MTDTKSMFHYPDPPESRDDLSPIEPARQNDFREVTIAPEVESASWANARSALKVNPTTIDPTREAAADEWAGISIQSGALSATEPTRLLGDDPERRTALIVNIGTEIIQLAPTREALSAGSSAGTATAFTLPVSATPIRISTTRQVWAIATAGTAAGISVFVERGARVR